MKASTNSHSMSASRSAGVLVLGAALALAGCGPKTPATPTTLGAASPMTAPDSSRMGQPVPAVQGAVQPGYPTTAAPVANTAPGYAQAPVQTAQGQQPYVPQPQYAQQQPQQYAQPQPTQYAPPPPQYAPQPQPPYSPPPQRVVASATMGSIEHIEEIRTRPKGSGAGAVIGGVLGAVVGNQFGHGGGRTGMTVLGAAGGALAGNNLERNHNEGVSGYRVVVRMDNGQVHTYEESNLDGLRIGDRVHAAGGRLHRA